MACVPWLRRDGDTYSVDRIDPCEAGTCGHAHCWQDDGELRDLDDARRDGHEARVGP